MLHEGECSGRFVEILPSSITIEYEPSVLPTFSYPSEAHNVLVHLLFCYSINFWTVRTVTYSLIAHSGSCLTGPCKYSYLQGLSGLHADENRSIISPVIRRTHINYKFWRSLAVALNVYPLSSSTVIL